jgi:hypothetical protein
VDGFPILILATAADKAEEEFSPLARDEGRRLPPATIAGTGQTVSFAFGVAVESVMNFDG